MRRIGLAVALLTVVVSAGFAVQQSPTVEVRKDDTLWELAGLHLNDPFQWGRFVEANSFLQEPGRVFTRGEMVIAIIRPGEALVVPRGMAVVPRPVPLSEVTFRGGVPWLWFLLAGLALALLAFIISYLMWRLRTANPATSGPPIVEGGISPNEPSRVRERFQDIAFGRYQRERPTPGLTPEQFQVVGEVDHGRFYGAATVRYRDGREERKRFSGDTGYRARVRYPDGREETLYFLQACANDVRYEGRRYVFGRDFRFVPVAFVRRPEPVAAPAATTPQPAVVATAGGSNTVTIRVGERQVVVPVGTTVHLRGETLTVEQLGGSVIVLEPTPATRVHELRPRAQAD